MGRASRDQFFSMLHSLNLRPRGFKKVRHTFSREFESYGEHYQLQGSAWNDEASDWRFYINCGISFSGVPRREPDLDFPRVHAWARAPHLVHFALPHYDVIADDPTSVVSDVVSVIDECSSYFARRHGYLVEAYARRDFKWPFLRDPELETIHSRGQPPNTSLERTRDR
jgi:Domain of unknown function (DUF4304)